MRGDTTAVRVDIPATPNQSLRGEGLNDRNGPKNEPAAREMVLDVTTSPTSIDRMD